MNPYDVCASCARYIKRGVALCPFCGAQGRLQGPLERSGWKRMSRAKWLAYGGSAIALLGCTNSGTHDNSGFRCNTGGLPMANDVVCDRASEWCFTNHSHDPTGCVSLSTTCGLPASGACNEVFYWDASACVPVTPRCACLTVTCSSGWCSDDAEGGITVSCGSCYGAPPVRLERVA